MKKLALIFSFVFLVSFASVHTSPPNQNIKKEQLYIVMVHSYNINHICGTPQEKGFLKALDNIASKYKLKIETFYLNGKHKTDIELELLGKEIAKKIQVRKPDLVVSFDDIAVQYVLSKQELADYPKFSSGLNKLINEYVQEGHVLPNFCSVVEEEVDFSALKKLLQKNQILKNKKLHVLTDNTVVSKQLLRDFRKAFNDNEYQLVEITNINQLESYITKLNYKKDTVINFLQVIEEGNEFILKDKTIYYISKLYPDLVQITTNKSSINFDADIVVGIDFELMGYMLGNSLEKYLSTRTCKNEITKTPNGLYVNYKSISNGKFDFSKNESELFEIVK